MTKLVKDTVTGANRQRTSNYSTSSACSSGSLGNFGRKSLRQRSSGAENWQRLGAVVSIARLPVGHDLDSWVQGKIDWAKFCLLPEQLQIAKVEWGQSVLYLKCPRAMDMMCGSHALLRIFTGQIAIPEGRPVWAVRPSLVVRSF